MIFEIFRDTNKNLHAFIESNELLFYDGAEEINLSHYLKELFEDEVPFHIENIVDKHLNNIVDKQLNMVRGFSQLPRPEGRSLRKIES